MIKFENVTMRQCNYLYLDFFRKHFILSLHIVSCGTLYETKQAQNNLEQKVEEGMRIWRIK